MSYHNNYKYGYKLQCLIVLSIIVSTILLVSCAEKPSVKVINPERGMIMESFTEQAKTRLENTYLISMPVTGRISRIDLEPGDCVTAGQTLAEFDLLMLEEMVKEARAAVQEYEAQLNVKDDNTLENTAMEEMEATVEASREALKATDAQVEAEKARLSRANKELERKEELARSNAVSESILDDVRLSAETALIDLRKEEFNRAAINAITVAVELGPRFVREYISRKKLERIVIVSRLAQARSRLARAEHDLRMASLTSPIDGIILEKYEQGDGTFQVGDPVLLIGNLDELEVIADILTQDALRIAPGSRVILEPAAGLEKLDGSVRKVEPAGFTKLSSLGVEQQRVNAIVSFDGSHGNLGVGYRVQARFITGTRDNAMIVPRFSVLQAPDRSYYVFKVAHDMLYKQNIEIGLRSDIDLEVVKGLSEQDIIVSHPDTTLEDGMKVKVTQD